MANKIHQKISFYIKQWGKRGYEKGIPQHVPDGLMRLNLAPSYKAVAIAILKNDHNLISLGFSAPKSSWYDALKKMEIEKRNETL